MKHALLPVLAFLLVNAAAGQSPDAARARQAYERANKLFEQNQLTQSMAALDEALAADSKNVSALTESGNPVAEAPGVRLLRMEAGMAVFAVESGRYRFDSR